MILLIDCLCHPCGILFNRKDLVMLSKGLIGYPQMMNLVILSGDQKNQNQKRRPDKNLPFHKPPLSRTIVPNLFIHSSVWNDF